VQKSDTPATPAATWTGGVRALLATLCWSSSALLIDQITTRYHLSALEISMWRTLLVLPILAIIIAVWHPSSFRVNPRHLIWYIAVGAGLTLSNVTWAVSVQINRPAAAAALGFSAPAFIAISERLLFKTPIRSVQAITIIINLLGCALASGIRTPHALIHSPVGLLFGLANGAAFTLYTLLNRGMGPGRLHDPLTTLLIGFAVSEIGMLLWGVPLEGLRLFQLHLNLSGWFLLLGVAVGPTLLAYALFNSSLRRLPATIASMITTLEPPIVAVSAFLLLGRTIDPMQWAGIGLIVIAVLIMQLSAAGLALFRPRVQRT
jgi:drug/metabolite transporter (DMT)-like permease